MGNLPRWMTAHMRGVLYFVHNFKDDRKYLLTPNNFIPSALLRLAGEGYITIGKIVCLTELGKDAALLC